MVWFGAYFLARAPSPRSGPCLYLRDRYVAILTFHLSAKARRKKEERKRTKKDVQEDRKQPCNNTLV